MNVLVTGGGGFIGSHLVESQLQQGHYVRTVDRHIDRLAHLCGNPRLEMLVGDITDDGLMQRALVGIDRVYHLASAHLETSIPDARFWEVNVHAVGRLLAAARAAGVQRVVHCSTVGVFGDLVQVPADESTTCRPSNIYEQTKLAGEQAARQVGTELGLPVVVARPAWVYGPGCPRTAKLLRTIKKRRFVMVGSGQALRHPIFIDDAVYGLERCAEVDGVSGEAFILAGDAPVTVEQLTCAVAEVVGVRPPSVRLPVLPAKAIGVMLQQIGKIIGREPPFSRRSVDFFLKDNAYDTSKAREQLQFRPYIGLCEGLERTWNAMQTARRTAIV